MIGMIKSSPKHRKQHSTGLCIAVNSMVWGGYRATVCFKPYRTTAVIYFGVEQFQGIVHFTFDQNTFFFKALQLPEMVLTSFEQDLIIFLKIKIKF